MSKIELLKDDKGYYLWIESGPGVETACGDPQTDTIVRMDTDDLYKLNSDVVKAIWSKND